MRHFAARFPSPDRLDDDPKQHWPVHPAPQGLNPSECALLVLGCQVGDFDDRVDAGQTLAKIRASVETVRRFSSQIIFSPLALDSLERQFIPPTNKEFFALNSRNPFQQCTTAAGIHPGVGCGPDDLVMRRIRLGALSTTGLDMHLTNCGVTTLFVAGVDTSGAILSTVREAADCDYRLILLSDCISDRDEVAHRLLFDRIFPRQAEITTVDVLARKLRETAPEVDAT